ncbi:hypothetical protein M1D52_04125 [Olivibacter sp. SA151]|uniref:hypothetical protein n=1 Tax=Olivibacter jilunii TaxID=985016 RepID=UPI003F5CE725
MLRHYHLHTVFLFFLNTSICHAFTVPTLPEVTNSVNDEYSIASNRQQDDKGKNKKPEKTKQQVEVKQVPKAKKQNAPVKVKPNIKVKPKVIRPKIRSIK